LIDQNTAPIKEVRFFPFAMYNPAPDCGASMNRPSLERTAAHSRIFNLKEYEALRVEINDTLREIRMIERYAVAGSGAIWAWLATRPNLHAAAWVLPLLLVAAGFIRNSILYAHVRQLADYIRLIEEYLLKDSPGPKGWEGYLKPIAEKNSFAFEESIVWVFLLLVGVLALAFHNQIGPRNPDAPSNVVQVAPCPAPAAVKTSPQQK
jgi:hypothetical protein